MSSPSTEGSWPAGSTSEAGAGDQRSRQRGHRARDARGRAGRSLSAASPSRCANAIPHGHKLALAPIAAGRAGPQVRQPDRHSRPPTFRPARTSTSTTSPAAAGAAISTAHCRSRGWPSRPTPANPTRRSRRVHAGDPRPAPGHDDARVPRLSPCGRPRRHAQPRAGRPDGDLRVGRRGTDRRGGGADRDRAAAPRRLRPARARHAGHARYAGRVLRPSEHRCGAGRRARMRAGGRAAPGRRGAACRQAGRDRGDPDRGRHGPHHRERDRDRAGDGGAARQPGARMVRRSAISCCR